MEKTVDSIARREEGIKILNVRVHGAFEIFDFTNSIIA